VTTSVPVSVRRCSPVQYYFMIALFAYGTVFGMMGMTMHLRNNFNIFADPVTPLILLIMILFGDLLQRLCMRLANIKVLCMQLSENQWQSNLMRCLLRRHNSV
jgi:hypothetical protein